MYELFSSRGAAGVRRILAGTLMAGLAACSAGARAGDDHGEGTHRRPAVQPAIYKQECGACHLAFPAHLLPTASWQRLMSGLDRHYGVDASLDPAAARTIRQWLEQNAASGWRSVGTPPEDRITRSRTFLRQHDELRASVWTRASVRSPANCSACHRGAADGDFNEHSVRIPA